MDVEEIQRRARSGPLVMIARRAVAVIIGILSTVTIPHLVTPRAYGLAAMSGVLFSFAEMFKDFGLTSALMRKGHVRSDEVNFLFWFNVAVTSLLTVILAIIAPVAGVFFRSSIVTYVILVSLIGFFIGGVTLQHRSMLTRDLKFTQVALIDTAALTVTFLTTLCLAAVHFDVWAIVGGSVCGALAGALLYIATGKWVPGKPSVIAEARELLSFGANTTVYGFSVFISNNIAAIMIGRVLGPTILGQFNRATAFLAIPVQNAVEPMAHAALPVLARLRIYPDLYKQAYLSLITKLSMIVLPSAIGLTWVARPLVLAVLGQKWDQAGQILQALAPAIAAHGLGYAAGDLFITQNRAKELRILGIGEMVVRVAAVSIGLIFGPIGAALGFSIATLAVVVVRAIVAGRSGPVTSSDHFKACIPALPMALGAAVGCTAAAFASDYAAISALGVTIMVCAFGGVGALACGLSIRASRAALFEAAAMLHVPSLNRLR